MERETIFVCTHGAAGNEHVAHVRAWDALEAAELFARELELELGEGAVPLDEIVVRRVSTALAGAVPA